MADNATPPTVTPNGTPAAAAASQATAGNTPAADVSGLQAKLAESEKRIADLQRGFTELSTSVPKEVRERLAALGEHRDEALALVERLAKADVDWKRELENVEKALSPAQDDPMASLDLPEPVKQRIAAQDEQTRQMARRLEQMEKQFADGRKESLVERQRSADEYLMSTLGQLGLPVDDSPRARAVINEAYGLLMQRGLTSDSAATKAQIESIKDDMAAFGKEMGWELRSPATRTNRDVVYPGSGVPGDNLPETPPDPAQFLDPQGRFDMRAAMTAAMKQGGIDVSDKGGLRR